MANSKIFSFEMKMVLNTVKMIEEFMRDTKKAKSTIQTEISQLDF